MVMIVSRFIDKSKMECGDGHRETSEPEEGWPHCWPGITLGPARASLLLWSLVPELGGLLALRALGRCC